MTDSPSTAPLPLSPAPPRRRWLGRVLALLLVLALVGTAWWLVQRSKAPAAAIASALAKSGVM